MSNPFVSVVMPVYNAGQYLRDAIDSILSQTYKDFEFIIIDDGSTDCSPDILKEFAGQDARIVILTNERNEGIVHALNRGIASAKGKYIVRMDADDISLPGRFIKQVEYMEGHPSTGVCGASLSYINAQGEDSGILRYGQPDRSLLLKTPLLHPTVIIRSSVLKEHNLAYIEKYRFAEDYFLWLQIARRSAIASIDDVVLKYRLSSQATKIKRLKGILWATIMVKVDGFLKLGLRPTIQDAGVFLSEWVLLALPSRLVYWLFLKFNLKEVKHFNL
jgi:glycosyltransferase involved in cell wall biosynthesis